MAHVRTSAGPLKPLLTELDPSNKYGTRRVWAALRALGLEPEDIDPAREEIVVNPSIPDPKRIQHVKDQRKEVWDGLRQARLKELKELLEGMPNDDVGRFEKCGQGVRPVEADDLPSVDNLAGMGDFAAMQAAKYAKVKAEQQRKANALVTGFLTEKKRMEEAEAKIAAFEARQKELQKQKNLELKAKRAEAVKKQEKMQQQIQRAATERAAYEDKTEEKALEKLTNARATRTHTYSKEGLQAKIEAANAKRTQAAEQAAQQEADLLRSIEAKQVASAQRLAEDQERQAIELDNRRAETQASFQRKRMKIYEDEQEWIGNKLSGHAAFKDKFATAKSTYKGNLKFRSKSCSDISRKAHEKWKVNHDRILASTSAGNAALLEKHQKATDHVEYNNSLKLKCGVDVHEMREVKYNTWGELQRRRWDELQRSRDAHTQALVFEVAERQKKDQVQDGSNNEMKRRRQQIGKETLSLNDRATEAFIKMQSEPDEGKIRTMMLNLGFSMPKLPEEEEEEADKK